MTSASWGPQAPSPAILTSVPKSPNSHWGGLDAMSLRCQSRIQIIGVSLPGLQVDGNELFGGLSHEPVRNTDAMIGWGCMNAAGASPTFFSVMEKQISDA